MGGGGWGGTTEYNNGVVVAGSRPIMHVLAVSSFPRAVPKPHLGIGLGLSRYLPWPARIPPPTTDDKNVNGACLLWPELQWHVQHPPPPYTFGPQPHQLCIPFGLDNLIGPILAKIGKETLMRVVMVLMGAGVSMAVFWRGGGGVRDGLQRNWGDLPCAQQPKLSRLKGYF